MSEHLPTPSLDRAAPAGRADRADRAMPDGDAARRGEILRPAQIFDPVARALDVIGDRWSLVLVRQLLPGPKGFQELRVRTGITPKVLSSRLRQLRDDGFLEARPQGNRSIYAVTEKGRSLEPIIQSIARWWVHEGIQALDVDATKFSETSAQSVFESLPVLLREERARGAQVVFEIRLSGPGGGVWTVEIRDGRCEIRPEFAEGADVRYTATARDWCAVALGFLDAKEAVKSGRLHKEGGPQAMDEFFHQIARPRRRGRTPATGRGRTPATEPGRTPATEPGRTPATEPGRTPATEPGRTPTKEGEAP